MRLKTIICLLCMNAAVLCAQNTVSESAFDYFEKGRFSESDSIVKSSLGTLKGQELVTAYRLLALSAFYQDKFLESEQWAKKLLAQDPYYKDYGADPRFQDMLERLKTGSNTIRTASKQQESLEEAPVPVTVITEEMIRISGCRTVRELLCLFVPGMVRIENMESNVAMRGLYGNSQENILVMQDGHRLNSAVNNSEPMDYNINVDKIDHIEVLRGPASSLYGNMALSAVVNIFTKDGANLSGSSLKVSGGMFGQFGASFMYGQGDLHKEFAFWAAVTSSRGERIDVNGKTNYLGGFNGLPAFDLGMKARWGDVNLAVTANHSKPVPRYMLISFDEPYAYDDYDSNDGEHPGLSHLSVNVDLDYNHNFGRVTLGANAYAHYEQRQIYNVMGDSVPFGVAYLMLKTLKLEDLNMSSPYDVVKTSGVWQTISNKAMTFGGGANASWNYGQETGQHGSILVGGQYEHVILTDSRFQLGYNYDKIQYSQNHIIEKGRDFTISGIAQIKHYFIPNKLVLNGGLRFDHKQRFDDEKTNTFSPRAALVYMPSKIWSTRLGYSRAYVDAPYIYRASNLVFFSGGKNMQSQTMDAFSLSGAWDRKDIGLRMELNAFYNMSLHQVVYSPTETFANGGSPFYNADHVDVGGLEFVGEWKRIDRNGALGTYINLNATYQHAFRLEHYGSTEDMRIGNIPEFLLNLTAGVRVVNAKRGGELWLRGNMHFETATPLIQNRLSSLVPKNMLKMNVKDYQEAFKSVKNVLENFPDETVRLKVGLIFAQFYLMDASSLVKPLSPESKASIRQLEETISSKMPEDGKRIAYLIEAVIGDRASEASFYENGPQVMLNLGADWRIKYQPNKNNRWLTLSLDVYNATNGNYKYGSLLNSYIPSQSLSVIGKVGIEF
ncbi:MAG: TonB-dependent receptor [Bacteroidaceae bacterium]|nr:TonB-dependent receptor [Bacteroidaceae bacterium]